jgi:hypothetical protein
MRNDKGRHGESHKWSRDSLMSDPGSEAEIEKYQTLGRIWWESVKFVSKRHLMIVLSFPSEIRTGHFLNTRQKRYRLDHRGRYQWYFWWVIYRHSLYRSSFFFFFVCWGRVRLSPFGMSATNWPIVPAPVDRWVWSSWWNENWQGELKYSEKTCPSAALSITNPTWPDLAGD